MDRIPEHCDGFESGDPARWLSVSSNPLPAEGEPVLAELVPEPPLAPQPIHWRLPLALFVFTCLSTFVAGGSTPDSFSVVNGAVYSLCLMTILVCHEAGHYVQTRRYGVTASLPFFIPFPFSPIGTMGAVILMDSRVRDRRALFDIGISGPLAGLVPTLLCCTLGLAYDSRVAEAVAPAGSFSLGDPLLFKFFYHIIYGAIPEGSDVFIGPVAMAGWVGLLITSLNLFPIGQLDGGHILYALLPRKANKAATLILYGVLAAVVVGIAVFHVYDLKGWTLMLALLFWMKPVHPPTHDDYVPLGAGRIVLGWLTLAFLIIGFTPTPLIQH
ncbi:MAG: site-2 protease family protein [Thermoguttaceae bacterium]